MVCNKKNELSHVDGHDPPAHRVHSAPRTPSIRKDVFFCLALKFICISVTCSQVITILGHSVFFHLNVNSWVIIAQLRVSLQRQRKSFI